MAVAEKQVAIVGFLAFCGPGIFNALNGLGNAGSDDPTIAALANGCLYSTFAICGYFGGAAFNLFGPVPLLSLGGFTYAIYAICISFMVKQQDLGGGGDGNTPMPLAPHTLHGEKALAMIGGVVLGMGAGLFWTAQGSLMMAYATPQSRGRLIALFWIIFNLGGVVGGLLQFGLNYHTAGGGSSPMSYYAFVAVMLFGPLAAPLVLASPSEVVREDGSPVVFKKAESPSEEIRAALQAIGDPFIQRNLLMYLASNLFYTYSFNGFNGHQFNIRTRGLNSAIFWAAQILAAWLFGKLLDADVPPRRRAWWGVLVIMFGMPLTMGLALRTHFNGACHGGWDKLHPCALDYIGDFPKACFPMTVYALQGAVDAVYQNYAYWLMSMAAGGNVRKTVMYSAVYKGAQSMGACAAWLIDLQPGISYYSQGLFVLVVTLLSCLPILPTLDSISCKRSDGFP